MKMPCGIGITFKDRDDIMTERRYYTERAGRGPATAALSLDDLKRSLGSYLHHLEGEGYFQEDLGYECVDAGFVPGLVGTDLETELVLTLSKPELYPIGSTIEDWSEDDLFDMVEFLFDHVSKPTERHYHNYSSCGWHCSEFDREAGRLEYRSKVNRLLNRYDTGFDLSEEGEVLAVPPSGLEPLMEAEVPHENAAQVTARIEAAKKKFRRHRSSIEDRRDAVRDLADVLEFLRPQVRKVLLSQDERDLFNIANNFQVRHNNQNQKFDYDKSVWLSWMFYFYLATIHAVLRLLERERQE